MFAESAGGDRKKKVVGGGLKFGGSSCLAAMPIKLCFGAIRTQQNVLSVSMLLEWMETAKAGEENN